MQLTYAPDEPQLFLLREKPEDPQIEPHARIKMAQGLVSPSSISVSSLDNFRLKKLIFRKQSNFNMVLIKKNMTQHLLGYPLFHQKFLRMVPPSQFCSVFVKIVFVVT